MKIKTYRASSRAALGLQNRPLLSIFGIMLCLEEVVVTESLDFSKVSCTANAEQVTRELETWRFWAPKFTNWEYFLREDEVLTWNMKWVLDEELRSEVASIEMALCSAKLVLLALKLVDNDT